MTTPYQNYTVVLPDQFRHGQPDELSHLLPFIIVDRAGKFLHGRIAVTTSSKIAQSIACRVFSVPIFVIDPHTTAFQHIEEPEPQFRKSYHEGAPVAQVLIDAAQVACPTSARSRAHLSCQGQHKGVEQIPATNPMLWEVADIVEQIFRIAAICNLRDISPEVTPGAHPLAAREIAGPEAPANYAMNQATMARRAPT